MPDHRHSYYPPNPNLGYQPPSTTRMLIWLMHAVGWVLLIPSALATIACLFFIAFGLVMLVVGIYGFAELVSWLILLGISGLLMTIGLVMTEKIGLRRND
jgi:hypothetical protein